MPLIFVRSVGLGGIFIVSLRNPAGSPLIVYTDALAVLRCESAAQVRQGTWQPCVQWEFR